ncbi:hypothetical protein [Burkholderia sp. Ax-1724]|uniref:hypothetical protein n=1 Tax=Burkholderia sp. Ax-1724 TaxID=2608336 RepID=UPI001422400D|nr:hypothetical protein [Burkholderia sp. Ax-1724]NIF51445.1 hypothetical protein [Burkholderia sp. Ax-1724]
MPYAPKNATPELILSLMKPGSTYAPYKLGHKVGMSSADIKVILLDLVAAGKVEATKPHKGVRFILANTMRLREKVVEKPVIDPATIAMPRTFEVMSGQLVGYDAEIARRRALCMLIRSNGE